MDEEKDNESPECKVRIKKDNGDFVVFKTGTFFYDEDFDDLSEEVRKVSVRLMAELREAGVDASGVDDELFGSIVGGAFAQVSKLAVEHVTVDKPHTIDQDKIVWADIDGLVINQGEVIRQPGQDVDDDDVDDIDNWMREDLKG